MRIWAISDLHLSLEVQKPMDVFGGEWDGYVEKIAENWQKMIKEDDIVLIAGDISWAMKLEETKKDFEFIEKLNGTKIIIKGNHEYWWKSVSAVRNVLPKNVYALQNDSIKIGSYIFTGTRGWTIPESANDPTFTNDDQKIYEREAIRLNLALSHAQKQRKEGDKVFCMIHYPPFNSKREDSKFTNLFEEYKVDKVIYGHLHKNPGRLTLEYSKKGIDYYLTSADLIKMLPVLIYED